MTLAGPIADALGRGATVVAASSRAARALHLQFAQLQRLRGRSVWPTPAIVDWDSWLRELWQEYTFADPGAPLLLTALQERTLWLEAQGADAGNVVSPEAMADLAMEAWALLSQYRAHDQRRISWEQHDAERFRGWATAFERGCARHGWLSSSQLEEGLAAAEDLPLPPELWLVGFDRMRPAGRALLESFESRGVIIHEFAPPAHDARRTWIEAADAREEIAACAAWSRQVLQANSMAKIGIIVPSLNDVRGPLERKLRHALMPESEDVRRPASTMPFEFSLGQPLAETPVVRSALLLLRWIAGPVRDEFVRWLMLSGYIGDTAGAAAPLARLDARERCAGRLVPERTLESYVALLAREAALRGLHERLGALGHFAAANRVDEQRRPASAWVELVHLLLQRAGWPGTRSPDSVQYQAQQRWDRLLDEIAMLDFAGATWSYREFLDILERQAQQAIFAPESQDAPIQIMGPAESSGQTFDALWFIGANDTRWPGRGRLHPLLPFAVQREHEMPHFAPEDDWKLAHSITARLLGSAPQIVFSYAQRDGDAELRPSPLIGGLFSEEATPAAQFILQEEPWLARTEKIADRSGEFPWPGARPAGGADVLRRQAGCAFQSFAVRRLAAEPLDPVEWGLSAADRGNLLHRVMQRLFDGSEPAALHEHADLVTAIGTNRLASVLEAHIDAAMEELAAPAAQDEWTRSYLAAEKRRLLARIEEWLTCEAGRQPFTVEACEQKLRNVEVGGLRLNLRADRIDRLPDGSRLLLDYKTGDVSPSAWEGDRPEEPQLPLYAAFGNVENLSGILFAQIRPGKTGFLGRVRDAKAQLTPDANTRSALVNAPYSEAMREGWSRVLKNLAEEFLRGEATVTPREPKVCQHCELHGLCRIAETNAASGNGAEEADA